MSVSFLRNCSIAALTIFSAQSAWADVSAQDVWAEWKAYLEGSGYAVTSSEAQSGDTLTISDLTMSIPIPEEETSVQVQMPTLTFVDNGDGSVNASFPAAAAIGFEVLGGPEEVKGEITLRSDGTAAVFTGDPDDMTYVYNPDLFEVALGSFTIGDEGLPPEVFSAVITMTDLNSSTHMKRGELRSYEQTYDLGALSYSFSFQDPTDATSTGTMKGDLEALTFAGSGVLPIEFDAADLGSMLAAGTAFDGIFSFGAGKSSASGTDGGDEFAFDSSSQGGTFEITMNADELKYDLLQKATELSVLASDLPFPIAFSAAEIGMKLQTPPTITDNDRDMALGVTLRDFNVPEALWAIADPAGILPHDPASIILDLSGKGRLLIDIFDPEATANAELEGETPALLNSVVVNQLLLRAAGAELTGTGAFELDYNDLESFDGVPAPVGIANLSLIGANGLIDNLIKMGLVSDSDASGARLMMGLLAVPGDGEDSLKSEIEFGEGGTISANGQRLK
ncbi:DUF2125 domain-containing protein [Epibacterium ulvae]|uniref:DUF2125 domain-containing protein n=1 Tax=Epibacterium ulvae TaxID=1156985 RepID=UPI001BFC58A7|nr:DUF2125 domain-containing protein [Epibacterium ulvae]MBT8153504.1 DUF2125 domain-containing protein [Epibacterium ulvae]